MNVNYLHLRRCFTLVEMLVVIAIIAILASLILPSLNRALDSSRSLSCMNNLRGIYLGGIVLYMNDYHNFIPAPAQVYRTSGYTFSRYIGCDYLGYVPNLSTQSGGTNWQLARGTALLCPADEKPNEGANIATAIPSSYQPYTYCGSAGSWSFIAKRLPQIKTPSRAGYLAESHASQNTGWPGYSSLLYPHQNNSCTTLLWLDGHGAPLNEFDAMVSPSFYGYWK